MWGLLVILRETAIQGAVNRQGRSIDNVATIPDSGIQLNVEMTYEFQCLKSLINMGAGGRKEGCRECHRGLEHLSGVILGWNG